MPSDGSGGPRLLLAVGDPKQAIYGFRGADVGTYLDARKLLADPATGQLHKLEFSFRSPKRLLDAFNDMCSDPDWFDAAPEGGDERAYPAPFNQNFFVQMNLAVGGTWPGNPDETTDFDKAEFLIWSEKFSKWVFFSVDLEAVRAACIGIW